MAADRVTIEMNGVGADIVRALEAKGHVVRVQGRQGSAHTIWVDPHSGVPVGVPDARDATAKATAAK